ncbi:hypothetical protein [Fuerstiella marisgermanici]|uniref:SAM dependent carboxyl methyltransferase n=1 Tax=Fuerstiella marisgermanici TaxID=1891926 RepID=A0A1P8WGQ0_9PLAN|nr:hypothetical protein [Fuerstiella marisgermanici]APZ93251.1 SAM dependent carboxyl methyltransferase [Fuerstiella marisgermanici]
MTAYVQKNRFDRLLNNRTGVSTVKLTVSSTASMMRPTSVMQDCERAQRISMKADGYYAANSQPQQSDVERALPLICETAEMAARQTLSANVLVADFGCADGRNSRRLTNAAIQSVRAVRPSAACTIVRNDRCENDFNQVASVSQGNLEATAGTFEFMSSGSFYKQLLPTGSMTLGTSFSAVHWMSRIPETLENSHAICREQLTGTEAEDARQVAEGDWSCFLQHRAQELASGGCLVVSMVGKLASDSQVHSPFRLISEALQQLIAEDVVCPETQDALFIPVYRRSLEEVVRPFEEDPCLKECGLTLTYASETEVACPLYSAFCEYGDVGRYAAAYVRFIRALAEPIVKAAFQQTVDEPERCMEMLFERMEQLVQQAPESWKLRRTQVLVAAQKV